MNGIQGLMPQGQPQAQPQMPGQAPMPGQMPGMQPGGGGPSPGISPQAPMLEKLSLDQLKQLYMQSMMPGSNAPVQPYAILSAISKKAQEAKLMQAIQNSSAQQQNAYQQGIGSIAEQVLQQADDAQEPVMARHGGEMNGYAGGGIVAFQKGGITDAQKAELMRLGITAATIEDAIKRGRTYEDLLRYSFRAQPVASVISSPEEQVVPEEAPLEQREARSTAIEKVLRMPEINPAAVAKGVAKTFISRGDPDYYKRQFMDPEAMMREIEGESRPLPQSPLPPEFALPPSQRMMDTRAIPAPRATGEGAATTRPVMPPPVTAPTTPFSGIAALAAKADPELEAAFRRKEAAAGISPADLASLKAKQEAEIAARTAAETGRSQRAEEARTRATQAYQEALTGQDGIFGPRGLFEIAAAIDPRRGQIMGSLARGAAGVMAREEKAKKEARTEYERAQQLYAQELNALDALRVATKERDTAITKGNVEDARAAEDRRAQIQIDYNRLREERTQAQRNLALEVAKAEQTAKYQTTMGEAAEKQARAAETTAAKPRTLTPYEQYKADPKGYEAYLKAIAEVKTEGAISKTVIEEMLKNPLRLQQLKELNPGLYNTVMLEAAKMGMTTALPPDAPVRD